MSDAKAVPKECPECGYVSSTVSWANQTTGQAPAHKCQPSPGRVIQRVRILEGEVAELKRKISELSNAPAGPLADRHE